MAGKYKVYPEYKYSEVEWLGDIPADWKMMRLKQTSSIQTGIAKGKDLSQIEDKIKIPYLRVANVQDGYLKLDDVSEIEIKTDELNEEVLSLLERIKTIIENSALNKEYLK